MPFQLWPRPINGIPVVLAYDRVTETNIRQFVTSLARLPVRHLQIMPRIEVGSRPFGSSGGGSSLSGQPGAPFIRVNRNCFTSSWNRGRYNYTLLHECGHIVDWTFHCMAIMNRRDRAGFDALMAHPHRGTTDGPGDHYADAYADYFCGKRISQQRRDALINSVAFENFDAGSHHWLATGESTVQ
jgi:hypothetical protein